MKKTALWIAAVTLSGVLTGCGTASALNIKTNRVAQQTNTTTNNTVSSSAPQVTNTADKTVKKTKKKESKKPVKKTVHHSSSSSSSHSSTPSHSTSSSSHSSTPTHTGSSSGNSSTPSHPSSPSGGQTGNSTGSGSTSSPQPALVEDTFATNYLNWSASPAAANLEYALEPSNYQGTKESDLDQITTQLGIGMLTAQQAKTEILSWSMWQDGNVYLAPTKNIAIPAGWLKANYVNVISKDYTSMPTTNSGMQQFVQGTLDQFIRPSIYQHLVVYYHSSTKEYVLTDLQVDFYSQSQPS